MDTRISTEGVEILHSIGKLKCYFLLYSGILVRVMKKTWFEKNGGTLSKVFLGLNNPHQIIVVSLLFAN